MKMRTHYTASWTLMIAFALGACARGPSPATQNSPAGAPDQGLAIRFDNTAETYVDVYLVGRQREWRLGRVAAGARAILQIPESSLTESSSFLRLAVLEGSPISVSAARDPRVTITIAQPASELLAQRWTFEQRQLAAPQILGIPADVVRRSSRPAP